MNTNKTVSIIMGTYNGAEYIREQLDSILSQTYPLKEIIIQDDGSTDDSGIICGLDLGMKTLVTCAVCDKATGNVITDEHSKKEIIGKIGDGSTIIESRNKYKIEGERIRKKCEMMGVNSHGRNAKMEEYYKYIQRRIKIC